MEEQNYYKAPVIQKEPATFNKDSPLYFRHSNLHVVIYAENKSTVELLRIQKETSFL